ncbi:MAG TPA: type II toxin-antitoxin system HicB family antitoxin [Thermoanaerobaculia bacterium]|nr:type II toxin-antitoxin system HicB family antitoxin [Thermoanaerobaculia bacterium]
MDYVVILEKGKKSFGAYVPDLPGCVAVGKTKREALRLIREAIEFHLDGMREDGLPIPEPSSSTELVIGPTWKKRFSWFWKRIERWPRRI